ncbi:extensin family protein [Sphingosinicella sp. BN140058]|uniref:extensin family protein n=1 Tax=Sphingosinicella sp. BN140058 TaxID=1892855 RepID=UPI0010130596|nr:extensin family protein [Sphingosinicella sp. BN140058]QAY76243.1 extensin family protein [Sphingosinicella sp. BN140058]
MRRGFVLLPLLLLASCIPGGRARDERPPAGATAPRAEDVRQCLADLGREGVRFKALPDRVFENGCSAIGAVQLLDIGTPTTNLKSMTCPLARQFARWTREALQTNARVWLKTRVVKIESFGTYSCRPINGQAGNRLSEHGRANAVDIAAFVLEDGRRITVLGGWNGPDEDVRRFLRAVHQAGCRRFGIVLGPDANALHRDHLHFDMGRGPYCR